MSALDFAGVIDARVLQRQQELQQSFASAQPFRHVVIDQFFTADFCARLVQQFPRFDERRAVNENGEVGGKATQEKVTGLGAAYRQLDELVQSASFLNLIETVTGIDDLRYDPYYFGGGTHENRHGQDLDPHVDFNYHPITRQHRRLNLIVYLNEQWDDAWGGALQFHRDPYLSPEQDEIITVSPSMNRCVIFETNEYSWHGFERINLPPEQQSLSRKSFALYYYTDSRPQRETAEEHSTVYVERHLPSTYRPGLTLDAAHVQELKTLLARRDQHLKRLYRNIHHLYGEVNRLKDQLPQGTDPQARPAASSGSAAGVADERMIRKLQARIHELEHSTSWRITAPLRRIRLWLRARAG